MCTCIHQMPYSKIALWNSFWVSIVVHVLYVFFVCLLKSHDKSIALSWFAFNTQLRESWKIRTKTEYLRVVRVLKSKGFSGLQVVLKNSKLLEVLWKKASFFGFAWLNTSRLLHYSVPFQQRFLCCMAFSVNKAICVACLLLSWLIVLCAPGETYLRDISLQTKQTVTPISLHFYY